MSDMTAAPPRLVIRRPDDWHVHLRDGAMLKTVLDYTARQFGRAIVMPNLGPPVTTTALAQAYRARIMAALGEGLDFEPLMTCYLTDSTDPADVEHGFRTGVFTAAKLYPAHATTNSAHGVTDAFRQSFGDDDCVAVHVIGRVVELGMERDRQVGRNRPWRGRPDQH